MPLKSCRFAQLRGHWADLDVPIWVIGEPLGTPGFETPSRILTVWPHRESIRQMTPNEFNVELDGVLANHCW
jgi:hypothetical protein